MYLFIRKNEYNAHVAALHPLTLTIEQDNVNNVQCFSVEISDEAAFNAYKPSMDADNFVTSDGVLLPESVRKKNQ